jgi:hypothetical protein
MSAGGRLRLPIDAQLRTNCLAYDSQESAVQVPAVIFESMHFVYQKYSASGSLFVRIYTHIRFQMMASHYA